MSARFPLRLKFGPLPAFLRTTAFGVALVQAALFSGFVILLLFVVYRVTAGQMLRDADIAILEEIDRIEAAFEDRGVMGANGQIIGRAAIDGPLLYMLTQADGWKISGDFDRIPAPAPPIIGARKYVAFRYEADTLGAPTRPRDARGQIVRLSEDYVVMVAHDLGAGAQLVRTITRATWVAGGLGIALSLALGIVASQAALRRLDGLYRTTAKVIGGDLTQRVENADGRDEYGRLASALNAMLDRLETLVAGARQTGEAIAHDLRTPLTRLRHRLESAQALSGPALDEELEEARREADHILSTFNTILRLTRLERGERPPLQAVDLSALAAEFAELYAPAFEDQSIRFEAAIAPGISGKGDPAFLEQCLANLLDNALKYVPAGAQVRLSAARRSKTEVELALFDSGPGVPAADRARITERFVRLDASRTIPGAGLGLAMVKAAMQAMGGQLLIEDGLPNEAGIGLAMRLVLPAH